MRKKTVALFLILTSTLFADRQVSGECDDGTEHMRLGLRHIEGRGIGYTNGYTTLELFLAAPPEKNNLMPFIDLRGHVFDNGTFAANGGGGVRSLIKDRVYGANVYYDFRNSKVKGCYNQVSAGLESLGALLDFRLNGYFPVGSKESHGFSPTFSSFQGHTLYLNQQFEYALTGTNGEVGAHYSLRDLNFYGAIGPYYFNGPIAGGVLGGQVRLNGSYKEYVTVEISYSYDSTFKNLFQGQISFNVPLGNRSEIKKKRGSPPSCATAKILQKRMVQPLPKDEIIVLNTGPKKSAAINPATGNPYTFVFVSNTSHSAGTFESPYPTLLEAQNASNPGDVIYVFPGDSTTTGQNAGIVLKNNQKLWGSAVNQAINTSVGLLAVPPQSANGVLANELPPVSTALLPVITSLTGDVVTLANNNEISGIYIQNLLGAGITSPARAIANLVVKNCVIQGPDTNLTTTPAGINLTNTSGSVVIDSNLIYQGIALVQIDSTSIQDASYLITNNDLSSLGDGIVMVQTDGSNIRSHISGNAFNISLSPINITYDNASTLKTSQLEIIDNQIYADSNTGNCVVFTLNGQSDVNVIVSANTINTPYTTAVIINQDQNSKLNIDVNTNSFQNWYSCLSFLLNQSSSGAATLSGTVNFNQFAFDAQSGINIVAGSSSSIRDFSIVDNEVQGVLQTYSPNADSVHIETRNNSTATVNILRNNFQSGANGLTLLTYNASKMTANIASNLIEHPQLYGLLLTTNNTSTGNWNVNQNGLVAVSGGSALGGTTTGSIVATSNNSSTTNLTFTNNLAAPIQLAIIPPAPQIGSFQFTQTGSSHFNLAPLSGNTGKITETGTITKL